MQFCNRLKELRVKHNLTQGDLAQILDLKSTAISNYESGRNEPSYGRLIMLAKHFNVSCDYLLGVTDSYLPINGEVIDKQVVDFFELYAKLDTTYKNEISDYAKWLIYKSENSL